MTAPGRSGKFGWRGRLGDPEYGNALQAAEPTPQLLAELISFFGDIDENVRRASGKTLAALAHRHSSVDSHVRTLLARACVDPKFAGRGTYGRAGLDYAYDALRTATEAHMANLSRRSGR